MIFPPEYVNAIAVSPSFTADQTCFAAQQNGLFRSTDGGVTWQEAQVSPTQGKFPVVLAVAFSPDFAQDQTVFAAVEGAVLRSTDGGDRWQAIPLPDHPAETSALLVSPGFRADGRVYCATFQHGIFTSGDRGISWTPVNIGLQERHVMSLEISPDFVKDQTLLAGTECGLFHSHDRGLSWQIFEYFPGQAEVVSSLAISPDFSADGVMLAGTEGGNLFYSQDRGRRWALASRFDLGIDQILLGIDFTSPPEVLIQVGEQLFYSTDEGRKWVERLFEGIDEIELTCLEAPFGISPKSSLLAGTAEHGVVWL